MGEQSADTDTMLVFAEGGIFCALPAASVQEVVFLPTLLRPPGMPSILEGIMTLDGKAVPVIRAAKLLGLEASPIGVYTPALVLKNARAALVVERMEDIFRPNPSEVVKSSHGQSFNDCVSAETRIKDREIHILAVDRLLLAEEERRIGEFQILAQARLNDNADDLIE